MKFRKGNSEIWAGTESSFDVAEAASVRMQSMPADFKVDSQTSTTDKPTSPLLSVVGGVGILQIAGSLVNNSESAGYNSYFGVTSYNNIREALALAVSDPLVKHILLDVNSGGGAVSGITDTAALISQISKNVKPMSTYSGGVMASGAYWLGVSTGDVSASDVAVIGSIGVITSHMDYSESLAQDGVKATVIRAGEFKQLNSPLEPLSAKGLSELQAGLDQVYGVFVQHVADSRSVPYTTADKQMAQGREFVGAAARSAGLIDQIATFDAVIGKLVSKVNLDTSKSFGNNTFNSLSKAKNMTLSLNEKQLAVISAGGTLSPEEIALATAQAATEELQAATAEAEAATTDLVEPEATAAEATAAEVVKSASNDLTAFLQTQLKATNEQLLEATIALRNLQTTSASAVANEKALLVIACGSVNKMNIALGGSERDLSAMPAVAVLAEHETVSVDFNKKFKVGGVAVAALNDVAETNLATVTPIAKARLNALKKGNK